MHFAKIAVNELHEPQHVARAVIDEEKLAELAESIKKLGVLNPIHVQDTDDGYEITAGHRRYLAARKAGLQMIPCLILSARDANPTAVKVHENLYRQEWTPVEEAAYFSELLPECGNDTDNVARLVNQSRAYVEGRLLMLQMDAEIIAAVAKQEIGLGVARELNQISQKKDRDYYLQWAITTGVTVATARQWRCNANAQVPATGGETPPPQSAPVVVTPERDIFECLLCGQREPVTDLEVWHIHRHCRLGAEARAKREEAAAVGTTPSPLTPLPTGEGRG